MSAKENLCNLKVCFVSLFIIIVFSTVGVGANRPGWRRRPVNWRLTGHGRIKAIHYPQHEAPHMRAQRHAHRPKALRKKSLPPESALRLELLGQESTAPMFATVVDSPPVDGFVPWVAVAVTDKRFHPDSIIWRAVPTRRVTGNPMAANPRSAYTIGILDSGASAHVMSYYGAAGGGLTGPYLTSNTIELTGVTGSVLARVSEPIGIFVDGIGAIQPDGLIHDASGMVGEWNTAIAVGDEIDSPNLPTAIGTPLSVYFASEFRNDQQVTVTRNEGSFSGPDVFFYGREDPCIPQYPNVIPLELRPLGGVNVQYIPIVDMSLEFSPMTPSVIVGNLYQSVFFVHSVDLYQGDRAAIDKDRFMIDTGAQVTVIGSRIAARLSLDPDSPDFEVEIEGVTGDSIMAPAFYIDAIEIPALGEWLAFTNVPVVWLDIASPEGGTIDGIIGMNLFVEFNFVFRGGGLFLQDDPTLEFGPIPHHIVADIAPRGGDGVVNTLDLGVFVDAWLATRAPGVLNWDQR
ncbi:MAG: retropepsin-like aspartic protease family protein, partial [Planctomycetota bacterium]